MKQISPSQIRNALLLFGMTCSLGAAAGELGDLLQAALQHPQLRAASTQVGAARAMEDAAAGKYFGSAVLSAGWHRYEDSRVVGVFAPGRTQPSLTSDSIAQTGVSYSLPVDVFGAIAANKARAQHDLRAAELLERQQALLKLHQAATAYLTLQSLHKQREALDWAQKRIAATARRVRAEFDLGKAAGVDARYAESEVARLTADAAVLAGAVAQAQADLAEATGHAGFLPTVAAMRVPAWDAPAEVALPVQIAQAKQQSSQAQA